ncbi:MAG: SGNH/GDSL hydrolase family protein [Pseudomonadota bacterium]
MKFTSKVVGAAALVCVSVSVSAMPYTSLVVIGDSLSDPGNAASLTSLGDGTSFFPPSPFPYAGRFTNGPTAAEVLADRIGSPTVLGWSGVPGGNNFAVGGALSGHGNFNALVNRPAGLPVLFPAVSQTGMAEQIDRYQASGAQPSNPHTLHLLWGGANDFFLGFAQAQAGVNVDFNGLVARTVANIATDLQDLVALGATNVLVPSLPDLGLTPLARSSGASFSANATALSHAYNRSLSAVIAQADAIPNLQVMGFDTAAFLQQTVAQPGGPFTNVTQSCLSGGLAALASNCAGYLFFDDVHPTGVAHALLGERFANVTSVSPVPEPQTWGLMAAALLGLPWALRRQRRARQAARSSHHGV